MIYGGRTAIDPKRRCSIGKRWGPPVMELTDAMRENIAEAKKKLEDYKPVFAIASTVMSKPYALLGEIGYGHSGLYYPRSVDFREKETPEKLPIQENSSRVISNNAAQLIYNGRRI